MKGIRLIRGPVWTGEGPVNLRDVRVEGDKIVSTEPSRGTLPEYAIEIEQHQLLIPGFHDAHLHLLEGGWLMQSLDFDGIDSAARFQEVLSAQVSSQGVERGEWITGRGLDETRIEITRANIDPVCSDNPVFLWSHDFHSAVVNATALKLAGITADTPDPAGGRLERDASGEPSGVLRENAVNLVWNMVPGPTPEQQKTALLNAQQRAFSLGITAASASVREDLLPGYLNFVDTPDQKIRINLWKVSEEFDFKADRFEIQNSERFRLATFKGFTDGALGSRSAAFHEPYDDDPGNSGIALTKEEPLAGFIRAAHREGYQVALHAIGDRANNLCLDAIEMAACSGVGPQLRPRIEHAQVLREKDIDRFAKLGVIASMQPIHCTADMPFVEFRIGSRRAKGAYAWNSLGKSGAALAFGSDWPVEDMNPLAGIHAAVTRQRADGSPPGGWHPEQCISVADALTAYTHGSAYAACWEDRLGKILPGRFADFTVLSQNLFTIPPSEILNTHADMTIIAGVIVHQRNQ